MSWLDRLMRRVAHVPAQIVTECPYCAASVVIAHPDVRKCSIIWDPEKSSFLVNISIISWACTCHGWPPSVLLAKSIPIVTAENSLCACGKMLVLRAHTLRRNGNSVDFEGEYVCESCRRSKNTVLRSIGRGLASFWSRTKRIEVGLKGVTYEKESTERGLP